MKIVFKKWKRRLRHYQLSRARVMDQPGLDKVPMAGWATIPAAIRADSVVYSFGVGNCVSWDISMINRYGVQIHAFDPTPRSIEWVEQQHLPDGFHFHPYGLADFDGDLKFYPPRKAGIVHFSQERRRHNHDETGVIQAPVKRLLSILDELDHQYVDVLKIDIEGSEFEAIPDLLSDGIYVGQLLVEIHDRFPTRQFADALRLIDCIKSNGMECFDISECGLEFSFVERSLITNRQVAA